MESAVDLDTIYQENLRLQKLYRDAFNRMRTELTELDKRLGKPRRIIPDDNDVYEGSLNISTCVIDDDEDKEYDMTESLFLPLDIILHPDFVPIIRKYYPNGMTIERMKTACDHASIYDTVRGIYTPRLYEEIERMNATQLKRDTETDENRKRKYHKAFRKHREVMDLTNAIIARIDECK